MWNGSEHDYHMLCHYKTKGHSKFQWLSVISKKNLKNKKNHRGLIQKDKNKSEKIPTGEIELYQAWSVIGEGMGDISSIVLQNLHFP